MTTCYICNADTDDLMTHLDSHVLAIGQHHPPDDSQRRKDREGLRQAGGPARAGWPAAGGDGVTTDKMRQTIWLYDRRPLADLTETLRRLAPLEVRGFITRSTSAEAAILLALEDLKRNGQEAAIYRAMVTPPAD